MKNKTLDKSWVESFITENPYGYSVLLINKKKKTKIKNKMTVTEKLIKEVRKSTGLPKKMVAKIVNEATAISKMAFKSPTIIDIKELLYDCVVSEISKIHNIRVDNTELKEKKSFFYPDTKGNKHFLIKFESDSSLMENNKEFNEIALSILQHASINNIVNQTDLLNSFIKERQVCDMIDDLSDDLNLTIKLDELESIEGYDENNSFILKEHVYAHNYFAASGLFNLDKKADKIKADKAIKRVLEHIIDKNPLCIKESDLLESIVNIEKKDKKGYNKFLSQAVLEHQILSTDPEYFQHYLVDPKKKKIKVNDYLKLHGLSLVKMIRV